MQKGSVQ